MLIVLAISGALFGVFRNTEAGLLSTFARLFSFAAADIEDALPPLLPASTASGDTPVLSAPNRPPGGAEIRREPRTPMAFLQADAIIAPLNPIGTMPAPEGVGGGQIFIYTVRSGDTLSSIAEAFDVSVNTILWANDLPSAKRIAVGQELLILPVSGVRHEVRKGDTVEAIAKRYRSSIEEILRFNGLGSDEPLVLGTVIIVPDGELPQAVPIVQRSGSAASFSSLPRYDGYYLRPIVAGRRSRGPHGYNGVDLADSCGLPVLAAAGGTVLIARASGWNGGYGRYLVIAHPNGTQTLYAHLQNLVVQVGQGVLKGQPVATIGSTGNSTGCHAHFEVRGARNPF